MSKDAEKVSALEEYERALRSTYVSRDADECGRTYYLVDEDKADAAITELLTLYWAVVKERDEARAEVERLKCCGNCGDASECGGFMDEHFTNGWNAHDPCHFTPSRWQECK